MVCAWNNNINSKHLRVNSLWDMHNPYNLSMFQASYNWDLMCNSCNRKWKKLWPSLVHLFSRNGRCASDECIFIPTDLFDLVRKRFLVLFESFFIALTKESFEGTNLANTCLWLHIELNWHQPYVWIYIFVTHTNLEPNFSVHISNSSSACINQRARDSLAACLPTSEKVCTQEHKCVKYDYYGGAHKIVALFLLYLFLVWRRFKCDVLVF